MDASLFLFHPALCSHLILLPSLPSSRPYIFVRAFFAHSRALHSYMKSTYLRETAGTNSPKGETLMLLAFHIMSRVGFWTLENSFAPKDQPKKDFHGEDESEIFSHKKKADIPPPPAKAA
jgi:hypothetical protein